MKKLALIGMFLLVSPLAHAGTIDWNFDPAHSVVGFSVKHLGITNVHGVFHEVSAVVKADSATGKVASVEATAKTASVDTGIAQRDGHLKSDDFFNAEKFPTLTVKASTVQWTGDKCSGTANLTIRDVTKAVPFTCDSWAYRR